MNCELIMLLPSKEHVEELKQKGIDLEVELSRIMYENLNLVKQGLAPKTIGVSIIIGNPAQKTRYDSPNDEIDHYQKDNKIPRHNFSIQKVSYQIPG